ncbi:hypothetical protein JCM11491_004430 [Sporobolomyces phaffii]
MAAVPVSLPSPPASPASSRPAPPPPPKLPLPPLPGSRLSFDPHRTPTTTPQMGYSSGSATTEDDSYSNDSHEEGDSSPGSTSPSSLTPTLPVTPRHDDKVLAFPSPARSTVAASSPACPFPTTGKRNPTFVRRRIPIDKDAAQSNDDDDEDDEDEDCGCGSPPQGLDSDDELDVLDFVMRDQQLALRTTKTSSSSTRAAGETGLGLFKRQGVEGLSLSPSAGRASHDGEPPALAEPQLVLRRPSTAPATTTPTPPGSGEASTLAVGSAAPTHRTRNRTISDFIPKLRLPKAGSSESDDSTDDDAARDSDETVPGEHRRTTTRRRRRKSSNKKSFDRFIMPTLEDLAEARQCELVGETGVVVTLDELIRQRGRVVFVALRHFWCNLCQQYVQALREAMLSLVQFQSSVDNLSTTTGSSVSVGAYHEPRAVIPPLYIVLVSTGSHRLIPTYRQRLDCPFPLYVDRSRKLYKTLGMTKSSLSMGKETDKGSYIKNSNWENMVNSTKNGIAMPRYPGPQAQLGGEFVFTHHKEDDSISCEYASRMHTTRAHAEIRELFAAAGVQLNDEDAQSVYGESMYSHAS